LDGLDEVETMMQRESVAAINAFIEEFKPSGLVVCCRLNEYRWLPQRLKLNGAICIEPLGSEEVHKYLVAGGSQLAALDNAVNKDPVLQELAQTPLMLSIMSLAYKGAESHELAEQPGYSLNERRKRVFGLYVNLMFQQKAKCLLVFPKEQIIGWLSWLAWKMREHSQSAFLVEALQPDWLGTTVQRIAYGGIVALTLGLTLGSLAGVMSAGERATAGSIVGLLISVGIALGCWSKSPLKNGLASGAIAGLIYRLGFDPSSTVQKVKILVLNDLEKAKIALALHFRA
jgi:hypothetical protein